MELKKSSRLIEQITAITLEQSVPHGSVHDVQVGLRYNIHQKFFSELQAPKNADLNSRGHMEMYLPA